MYMYSFASTRESMHFFSRCLSNAISPCLRTGGVSCCVLYMACLLSVLSCDHRCWRIRLSLERFVDVVLLGKEVSLDLCVLEELEITLCSAYVSLRSVIVVHPQDGLAPLQPGPRSDHFSSQAHHRTTHAQKKTYLADVHTSPGG
jgi:hypothetical protein